MKNNNSRNKVTIDLNGEFTTAEIEEIINELCKTRAAMMPEVSRNPPGEASESIVLEQENPLFSIRTLADGGIRIWLRNIGIGWLAFTLTSNDRKGLAEFLDKKAGHTYTTH